MPPCLHHAGGIFEGIPWQLGQKRRRGQNNLRGLARLKLQHAAPQRMPLEFAAELDKWGVPKIGELVSNALVAETDAMNRVCTCAPRLISHEACGSARHIREEEVGHLHIRNGVPWCSHAALVGLPRGISFVGIEIPFY